MPFDHHEHQRLLEAVENAQGNAEKGASFESLVEALLTSLDGVQIEHRDARMDAEEIDLVVWNAQVEEVFRPWDAVILVECKNWSTRVDAPQLDSFIGKMRRRNLKTGLFVAANGVTGGFLDGGGGSVGATELIKSALQEGIRVVVVTLDDLRAIDSLDKLRDLLRTRYCGLFVHRVF